MPTYLHRGVDPVFVQVCGAPLVRALLLPAVQQGGVNWTLCDGSVRVAGDGSVRPAITDGTSNTIVIGERLPSSRNRGGGAAGITDGTSNTLLFGETIAPGGRGGGLPSITDGSSNTIFFGETGLPGDGSVRFVSRGEQAAGVAVTDGTSNTIMFEESRPSVPIRYPHLLGGSFRLLLPARAAHLLRGRDMYLRMRHGFTGYGLEARGANATSFEPARGNRVLATLSAKGIIAILIGL